MIIIWRGLKKSVYALADRLRIFRYRLPVCQPRLKKHQLLMIMKMMMRRRSVMIMMTRNLMMMRRRTRMKILLMMVMVITMTWRWLDEQEPVNENKTGDDEWIRNFGFRHKMFAIGMKYVARNILIFVLKIVFGVYLLQSTMKVLKTNSE